MKTMLLAAVTAVLCASFASADNLDALSKKVDGAANAAHGKTDKGSAKADAAVTKTLGTDNPIAAAATSKVKGAEKGAKGKTNAGAAKAKGAIDKAKGKKAAAHAAVETKAAAADAKAASAVEAAGH